MDEDCRHRASPLSGQAHCRRPSFLAMGYYPGQACRHDAPGANAEIAYGREERGERRKEEKEKNNKIYLQGATVYESLL